MRILLLLVLLSNAVLAQPDYSGVWVSSGGRQPDNSLVLVHQGQRLTVMRNFANNTNVDQFVLGGDYQEAYLGDDQGINRQVHKREESRFFTNNGHLHQEFRLSVQNPDQTHGYRTVLETYRLSKSATQLSQSDGTRFLQYVRLNLAESEIRHQDGTFKRRARAFWDPGRGRLRVKLYSDGEREDETLTFRFKRDAPPYRHNLQDVELETSWGKAKLLPDRVVQPNLVFIPLFDARRQLVGVRFRLKQPETLRGQFLCSVWAEVVED